MNKLIERETPKTYFQVRNERKKIISLDSKELYSISKRNITTLFFLLEKTSKSKNLINILILKSLISVGILALYNSAPIFMSYFKLISRKKNLTFQYLNCLYFNGRKKEGINNLCS